MKKYAVSKSKKFPKQFLVEDYSVRKKINEVGKKETQLRIWCRDTEDKESAGTNLKENWKEISRKYTKKLYHLVFLLYNIVRASKMVPEILISWHSCPCLMSPLECGETNSNHDGMSLARSGYKKSMALILNTLSPYTYLCPTLYLQSHVLGEAIRQHWWGSPVPTCERISLPTII